MPYALVAATGWLGSAPYLLALPLVGLIVVASRFPGTVTGNVRRLPYFVLVLMILEVIHCFLDFTLSRGSARLYAYQNPYLAFNRWRFFTSVAIPAVWTRAWFSNSVRNYLEQISKTGAG